MGTVKPYQRLALPNTVYLRVLLLNFLNQKWPHGWADPLGGFDDLAAFDHEDIVDCLTSTCANLNRHCGAVGFA